MKKKYITPNIIVREISIHNILASSGEAQIEVENNEITTSTSTIKWD